VTTPITKDGRLSAKEMIGNNANLERLQDDYARRMAEFKLRRGLKSNRVHVPTKEFYKYVSSAAAKPEVKKHIEKHLKNLDIEVDFASRIAHMVDKKEIPVFGKEKAKNELKMEISQFVNNTFEKAKTVFKDDLIKLSMQGFDLFDQTNANYLAEDYVKKKEKLESIRMQEWRKEMDKIKPEIEQKTEIDRSIFRR
jgi:DNA polymerase III delta prime subunit